MKGSLLVLIVAIAFFHGSVSAQPNVFNPNDPVIDYDPSHPVAVPPPNTMAKWVRTRVNSWNTDKFKCYYFNGTAFRLRFPTGYNPSDPTRKYPLVVYYHGGGETAPNTDNETQVFYPAQKLETFADQGLFNAFLLFPVHSGPDIWSETELIRVNSITDSLLKYCYVDPDRISIMGLSMGAFASIRYSALYPQRSCLAMGASPALIETLADSSKDKLVHIPIWVGNGEQDVNPYPYYVNAFVEYMTNKGANIRHSFYPGKGHLIWGIQFEEAPFLPYFQNAHKANPQVFFGRNQFDRESAVNSRLGLSAGFYAYEWQKDNITIASSTNNVVKITDSSAVANYTGNDITVRAYGTYRARFKRTNSADWSDWSPNPAIIYKGLKYRYYEGAWNYLPDFNSMPPVESGSSPNVDLNSRKAGAENHYAMIWEGSIYIPAPGSYTFETVSVDGSKLYFNTPYSANAAALVNNDGTHGYNPASGTVNIAAAGNYPIAITYFNMQGSGSLQVNWSGPGFSKQPIPNAAFTPKPGLIDVVAPDAPANLKVADNDRSSVSLSWNKSLDDVAVTGYTVYLNGSEKLTTADTSITIDHLTPNTPYSFFVKAADAAGNVSSSSNTVTFTGAANGWKYRYYEGSWATLPNFGTLTPVKKGVSAKPDLSVRPAGVENNYAFVWEGYINIRTPGDYTFETFSDDGSKLYFNKFYSDTATALVNNDSIHSNKSATGTVRNLAAGIYPIAITFFQANGGANIQVYWTTPVTARQLIPDVAFIENVPDNTPPSTPANFKVNYTGRTFADISWDHSTDNVAVVKYDVYVNSFYRFSTTSNSVTVDSLKPNSNYYFEVKAFDQAGNVSPSSYTTSVTTAANGLKYRYYEGKWATLPNFGTLTPVKKGVSARPDLSVRPAGVDENYAFVWEGYINIKIPGDYTFETFSDDGSKLYFNKFYSDTATALVNNDSIHSNKSATGTVRNLAAGIYPIAITFFQATGGANIQVYWTTPIAARQLIPAGAFTEYYDGYSTNSAPAPVLNSAVLRDSSANDQNKLAGAHLYPNPFNKELNIRFYNSAGGNDISIGIYDLSGRLLYNKRFGKRAEGLNFLQLNVSGQIRLDAGTYLARLQVNGIPVKTWTLVKMKQ